MIEDLLELAELQGLTGRESTRPRDVHWFIDLDADGRVLQLSPTTAVSKKARSVLRESRGKQFQTPRLYHMQVIKGEINSVCTNQHNWLPDFLIGPAAEIFPHPDEMDAFLVSSQFQVGPAAQIISPWQENAQTPEAKKRWETWKLLFEASLEPSLRSHVGLRAVFSFLKSRPRLEAISLPIKDTDERNAILKSIAEGKELLSFRVAGKLLLHDPAIRQWWENRVAHMRSQVCNLLPKGEDGYEPGAGPLAEYFPTIFGSIPLCSFDKAPYTSFGLGRQTTRLRLETSEKVAAALNWLMNDDSSSLNFGEYTAVFWAVLESKAIPTDIATLLNSADPLAVRDFLRGPWCGIERDLDSTKFYAAMLRKSGKGRFAVSSWHTETLRAGIENLKAWFKAIKVSELNSSEQLFVTIRDLADCTVRKSRETRPLPATYHSLFESALFGNPLPHKMLAAAIARQSLELAQGTDKKKRKEFESRLTARTALIKAYFALQKGDSMQSPKTDPESNKGYLCGRLLAMLDKIHVEAHRDSGGTNSSPANRSYGAASTTPALIFPQLCRIARYHLNKIGGGWAYVLEHGSKDRSIEGLAAICARLRDVGTEFPRTLSLEDQGRFAIGFYVERCRNWSKAESSDNTQDIS